MAIRILEAHDSRAETVDQNDGTAELLFNILGAASPLAVRKAMLAPPVPGQAPGTFCPAEYHGLIRGPMRLTPTGPGQWKVAVNYSLNMRINMSYDGMCEKIRRHRSLDTYNPDTGTLTPGTIGNYQVHDLATQGADGPNFHGLIGVSKDKVEGVEVYAAGSGKLEIRYSLKYKSMDPEYLQTIKDMRATVNDSDVAFVYKNQNLRFDKGTLVYIGFVYNDTSTEGCDLTFRFEERDNEHVAIGEKTGFFPSIETRLADNISSSDTNIVVDAAGDFPVPSFVVRIDSEIILVTNTGTGFDWTVARGIAPSVPAAHSFNALVSYHGAVAPGGSIYSKIFKEGHWYLWVRYAKGKQPYAGGLIDLEVANSVHVERVYDYADFDPLQVFDIIDSGQEDLERELEAEQAVEESNPEKIFGEGLEGNVLL